MDAVIIRCTYMWLVTSVCLYIYMSLVYSRVLEKYFWGTGKSWKSPGIFFDQKSGKPGIQFRLCVLVYRCLHGSGPQYLAETLHLASNIDSRCRLRSGSTSTLLVPSTRRMTLGDRAFPVAAARAWNALPATTRTSSSYLTFRRQLKTFLYKSSFDVQET